MGKKYVTFGGGEANVAVSLSIFGEDAKFVEALAKGDGSGRVQR